MTGFTHLHVASGFSLRHGAAHVEQLVERAAQRGMTRLALTDRDTLSGCVRFVDACAVAGVAPVLGADVAVAVAPWRHRGEDAPPPAVEGGGVASPRESVTRVTLLARDRSGWAALCRLISAAHIGHTTSRSPPVLSWADLRQHVGGLIALLGPSSQPVQALTGGRGDLDASLNTELANGLLAPWRELFEGDLALEVVFHGRSGTGSGSLDLAAATLHLGAEQGIAAVLSNAVRYADPAQARVADVLDAARCRASIEARRLDSGERWLKGPGAMARLAELVTHAAGQEGGDRRLLAVTAECAERCAVQPGRDLGWGSVHFPEPQLVGASAATAAEMLRSRCAAAMAERGYDRDPAMTRRLAEELQVIEKLGYPNYFLTVAQVVDDTRNLRIRVAARGSAAGCLVTHLLGVTSANPVQHGLLMERFLSPRRTALPDIDIDVESARRLEVYQAIFDRFGADRVASVSMHVTYRVRHAIRDAGAALGLPPTQIDQLAKAFPQHLRARDARDALRELPELAAVAARATEYGRLWDLVEGLDGLPTSIAMHPCGVLLSDARLRDRTPVVPSGVGWPMSQFDTSDVERMGLLKLDVLGVRMQSAMVHAVAEVERTTGHRIDLDDPAQVPAEDPDTYQLIRSAQTLGCFQIESPGQRDLLGRLQPETFHDLVTDISLFRPGPVAADMVTPFIASRHGHRRPHYAHPDLTPALQETYGVLVWHEQVIRILACMTGCDHAEADEARRALSQPHAQERVRRWFAGQAHDRGYQSAVIEETWAILAAFGAYGFCKAHAVAFAVPTYQSAWLKAHHPAAFYAGVLTHDPGMYPGRVILADARRRGIEILPLDINRSGATYRIEPIDAGNATAGSGYGLRMALSQVHGITAAQTTRIIAGQPYTSLSDLWQRAHPTRPIAERLAQTGALETIAPGQTRRDVLAQIAQLHQRSAATIPTPAGGLPEMTGTQKLRAELAILGMDTSRHLMDHYRDLLAELGAIPAHQLAHTEHGTTVLVAGVKAAIQTPPTRSRHRVIFLTLDDADGLIDLAFLGNTHPDSAHTLFHCELLLVQGTLHHRGPHSHTVIGTRVWDLAELAATHRQAGLDAVHHLLTAPPPFTAPNTEHRR